MFSEDILASHGLGDAVVGGKAEMVHSDKRLILIKLPLNMEIPNFAAAVEGDAGKQVKSEEQQQTDYERKVAVQMQLLLTALTNS